MVAPSTMHPPGNLTKPGFRSASICARSGRDPWPLKVLAGKSETKSSHNVPFDAAARTNLAFGSLLVAVSVDLNCFQCAPKPLIFSALLQVEASGDSKDTVRGPVNPSAQRAQNDKSYLSPCATPMPQKPSLATANRPEPAFWISRRRDLGVAGVSGSAKSRCIEPCAPPSFMSDQKGRPLVT